MDSRDQRADAAGRLVKIMRKITRAVQIAPFAYLLLLGLYLICESLLPDWMIRISVNLLSVPADTAVGMLILGRWLKLCSWFKTACVLPFTTKVECYIDSFFYTFTQNEIALANSVIGILFLAFIYISFRHFFYGRQENPHRNPRLLQVQD